MTPEQFCYWLNGYFEVSYINDLTSDQVQIIKDHLATVFNKVTPNRKQDNTWVPPNPYPQIDRYINSWVAPYDKYREPPVSC